jgi:hypothetical protein
MALSDLARVEIVINVRINVRCASVESAGLVLDFVWLIRAVTSVSFLCQRLGLQPFLK